MEKRQPHLRLVVNRDALFDEPRKYAQSTSGRISSTKTAPALSRSSAIAVDSAIRSFLEMAFRRYPTDVLQRCAKSTWDSRSSELRYSRSDSMTRGVLLFSNSLAIPIVHSPSGTDSYNAEMVDYPSIRRRRLRELIAEYGSQQALADLLDVQQNYVSRLLNPKYSFGEKTARNIEQKTRKPLKWLDDEAQAQTTRSDEWPFSFDKSLWDRLSPQQKREIEASFTRQVLGANIEQAAVGTSRKRTG